MPPSEENARTEEHGCVYCRARGRASTSVEHFLPERFGYGHPFALPIGMVCDGCNRWAAREIDPSLIRAGGHAFDLFFHRVPGKRGKHSRFEAPGVVLDPVTGTAKFSSPGESAKALLRLHDFFARALHKVALGAAAQQRGVAVACDPALDHVAHYVREGGAFRPYAHALGRWIDPDVHLAFEVVGEPGTNVRVGIQISTETCWVMLAGSMAELDAIAVPVVRTIRARDHAPDPNADQVILCEGDGDVAVYRVPPGPPEAIIPSIYLQPEIQSFRSDAPRWRSASGQPQ